jgi:hypothetical protein
VLDWLLAHGPADALSPTEPGGCERLGALIAALASDRTRNAVSRWRLLSWLLAQPGVVCPASADALRSALSAGWETEALMFASAETVDEHELTWRGFTRVIALGLSNGAEEVIVAAGPMTGAVQTAVDEVYGSRVRHVDRQMHPIAQLVRACHRAAPHLSVLSQARPPGGASTTLLQAACCAALWLAEGELRAVDWAGAEVLSPLPSPPARARGNRPPQPPLAAPGRSTRAFDHVWGHRGVRDAAWRLELLVRNRPDVAWLPCWLFQSWGWMRHRVCMVDALPNVPPLLCLLLSIPTTPGPHFQARRQHLLGLQALLRTPHDLAHRPSPFSTEAPSQLILCPRRTPVQRRLGGGDIASGVHACEEAIAAASARSRPLALDMRALLHLAPLPMLWRATLSQEDRQVKPPPLTPSPPHPLGPVRRHAVTKRACPPPTDAQDAVWAQGPLDGDAIVWRFLACVGEAAYRRRRPAVVACMGGGVAPYDHPTGVARYDHPTDFAVAATAAAATDISLDPWSDTDSLLDPWSVTQMRRRAGYVGGSRMSAAQGEGVV